MRPVVGLIGYGRFGRLAASYIAREADVIVYEQKRGRRRGAPVHVHFGSLAEAASQSVVVFAVPISSLHDVLARASPFVRRGALVLDVCSVKVVPLRWLRHLLPRSVSVIGTHPLFGPDSDTGSLRGHHMVVCPGRISRYDLGAFCRSARRRGLRVHVMTPQAHDRLMADSLLLTQYVGRLLPAAGVRPRAWSAPSYEHLKELVSVAGNDTPRLFADMWRFNPYGQSLARRLRRAHLRLARKIQPGSIDS